MDYTILEQKWHLDGYIISFKVYYRIAGFVKVMVTAAAAVLAELRSNAPRRPKPYTLPDCLLRVPPPT